MRRADESTTPPVRRATGVRALRVLLAVVLVWTGVTGLAHHDAWARAWRAARLGTTGSVLSLALPVAALAAAALLASRRTAFTGAVVACATACVALVTTAATWLHGAPVACTCVGAAVRHGTRANVEAVVGDVVLLALACVTAWRTRDRAHLADSGTS